jgi:PDZ domain-containing protein
MHTSLLVLVALLAPQPAAEPVPPPAPGGAKQARARAPLTDRPNLGVQLVPITKAGPAEGVKINYIYPGSAAEAMGLKTGDELLELNGVALPTRQFLSRELPRNSTGSPLEFQVRRAGQLIKVRGPMGSFLKTRQAFNEHLEKNVLGKPIVTAGEIVWPEHVDGLALLKGKVGLVVSFDGCPECKSNFLRLADRFKKLKELKQDWIGMCGLYFNIEGSAERNLEDRKAFLAENQVDFHVGLVKYKDDVIPPDSAAQEALLQNHGVAVIDPEGKLLFVEVQSFKVDNSNTDLTRALAEAARKYAPRIEQPAAEPEKKAGDAEKKASGGEK